MFEVCNITISHSGKDETFKLVLRQTHQRAKDESLTVLPSHISQLGDIKLDLVTESVRRTDGIQELSILIHANVLQGTYLSGANTL